MTMCRWREAQRCVAMLRLFFISSTGMLTDKSLHVGVPRQGAQPTLALDFCRKRKRGVSAGGSAGGTAAIPCKSLGALAAGLLELAAGCEGGGSAGGCSRRASASATGSGGRIAGKRSGKASISTAGIARGNGWNTTAGWTARLRGQHRRNASTLGGVGGYGGKVSNCKVSLM